MRQKRSTICQGSARVLHGACICLPFLLVDRSRGRAWVSTGIVFGLRQGVRTSAIVGRSKNRRGSLLDLCHSTVRVMACDVLPVLPVPLHSHFSAHGACMHVSRGAPRRCDPSPFYFFDEVDSALDPLYRTAVASTPRPAPPRLRSAPHRAHHVLACLLTGMHGFCLVYEKNKRRRRRRRKSAGE